MSQPDSLFEKDPTLANLLGLVSIHDVVRLKTLIANLVSETVVDLLKAPGDEAPPEGYVEGVQSLQAALHARIY